MSEKYELKSLRDFAIVPSIHEKLAVLADMAESEDWDYKDTLRRSIGLFFIIASREHSREFMNRRKFLIHWTINMLVGIRGWSQITKSLSSCCLTRT
jgi:hypothetical protein